MSAASHDDVSRRDFLYVFSGAAAGVGVAVTAWPFIDQMNPSAAVQALAATEVDLTPIQDGQQITVMWQGKPTWVRKRTQAEIDEVRAMPDSELKDPEADQDRVKKPEWLVVIGICTHLGCIPNRDNSKQPGGYLCACHGSVYDASGRILHGPAPANLPVPPYQFVSDTLIRIG
ncbi:MAG: ubiquinol-cytochrome c reductase iron-sulfur subunit [Alphaproteobacteria bacterium]|nr:ubiquinol-cytochrome c reductase iron-sulfur subunit [Alphaproteobacteria bacterium]